MKIALIGTAYPFRGGLAAYNERLARELQNQGHQVTIYTFTLQYPNFLFPGKSQMSDENSPTGLNINPCINSINPLNWWVTGNKIKKQEPDLVIIKYWLPFMGPCFGTILRLIKKNKKTTVVTIIDNIIPHESRPGDRIFTKYFIKPVDAFVAMSKNVLEDINQFDRNKPKIYSPHPVFDNFGEEIPRHEAIKRLDLDPQYKYMLFFGLIRDYKGLDLLIKAIADSRFTSSNIRLLVAGEYYSDSSKYTNLIKDNHLEEKIIQFDMFIPDSEVAYYFNACDLVVQPYKSATQSGVTQIAYHFNKPMIVTDVGGLREMCPDGKVGYVVEPDPIAIADAILKFFTATDQEEMILNIKEVKKKYSWAVLVENLFKLIKKIN